MASSAVRQPFDVSRFKLLNYFCTSIHKYSLSITCATLWPHCCLSHCRPPVLFYIRGAVPCRLSFLAIAADLVPPKGKVLSRGQKKKCLWFSLALSLSLPLPWGSISSGEVFLLRFSSFPTRKTDCDCCCSSLAASWLHFGLCLYHLYDYTFGLNSICFQRFKGFMFSKISLTKATTFGQDSSLHNAVTNSSLNRKCSKCACFFCQPKSNLVIKPVSLSS